MRITGWALFFDAYTQDKNVVTERELLEALLLAGRRINADDWRKVMAHAMRVIGWKHRRVSCTFVRLAPATANATIRGAS